MNKRQLNKILKLSEEGVSDQLCVAMIIEICAKTSRKNFLIFTADKIIEFFKAKREPDAVIYCRACGANPLAEPHIDLSVRDLAGPQNT